MTVALTVSSVTTLKCHRPRRTLTLKQLCNMSGRHGVVQLFQSSRHQSQETQDLRSCACGSMSSIMQDMFSLFEIPFLMWDINVSANTCNIQWPVYRRVGKASEELKVC